MIGIFLLISTCCAQYIDTNIETQIATLLTSSEVVSHYSPSPYVGIVHFTVVQAESNIYTINSTIWHDNPIATDIFLYGNASSGRGFEGDSIFRLHSGTAGSASIQACPITVSFNITSITYNLLLQGKLYVQISSISDGVGLYTGQQRGQLEERNDLFVSFIDNIHNTSNITTENITNATSKYTNANGYFTAAAGMALLFVTPKEDENTTLNLPVNIYTVLDVYFRMVSLIPSSAIGYLSQPSADTESGFLQKATFGQLQSTVPLFAKAVTEVRTNLLMVFGVDIGTGPRYGIGSCPAYLEIAYPPFDNQSMFVPFVRMPLNAGALTVLQNGSSINGSGL